MFFNVDKNTKQNMFQQYKKDALEYEQRKKQEKQKRIQEERDYLTLNQKRETLIEDKMKLDKLKRQRGIVHIRNEYQYHMDNFARNRDANTVAPSGLLVVKHTLS